MKDWLRKHKGTAIASGVSLALIILGWVLAWYRLRGIREPLILHYSTYTGINQIGGLSEVGGMAATALIIWGVDTVLAAALDDREPFWGRVVAYALLAFGVLLFSAFIAIIALNS